MKDKNKHDDKQIIKNSDSRNADSGNESQSEARRKAVRNILAGSGIAAGAASSGSWIKPAVDAVMTPAHAQTSVTVVVLQGSAQLTIPRTAAATPSRSVLDLFMDSAHAGIASGPSLDGACLTMTLDFVANTVELLIEYFSEPSITITGSISNGSTISGMGNGVSFTGSADPSAGTASGSISNGLTSYSFALSNEVTTCVPTAPRDTTTPPPTTTTGYPTTTTTTTGYPTTTTTTTGYPTTTTTTTPGFPTTTMMTTMPFTTNI